MAQTTALWQTDIEQHRTQADTGEMMRSAAAASDIRPFSIMLDYRKLAKGPGKLTFQEYVDYRLYDRTVHPDDNARLRFISEGIHWPLCYQCSDRRWDATTEDKWISETLLHSAGIGATRTLGIVDASARSYGSIPCLDDAATLSAFLRETGKPVFAKMNGGIGSEGATRIVAVEGDQYDVAGLGTVCIQALFANLSAAPEPYLLQEELTHHPEMATLFGPRIGTIRAISFVAGGKVHTPVFVLKLPTGNNIADNFWREGNMLVDLDRDTGTVRRMLRGKGPALDILDTHPETGAQVNGAVLPMWDEVKALTKAVGELYAPVKYQSLDIAITPDGPVVVEVNTGSAFNLYQLARGEGFFTDEIIGLFRACGAKIDLKRLREGGPQRA